MIRQPYVGSRFDASDQPLLSGAWQTIDSLKREGAAKTLLEVVSGERYRRQFSEDDKKMMGGTAYLLQVIMQPTKIDEGLSKRWWVGSANAIIGRFEEISTSVDAVVTPTKADLITSRNSGPFGSPSTEDAICYVNQPLLRAVHVGDSKNVELRVGVSTTFANYMFKEQPIAWDNRDVRVARRGRVIVPDPAKAEYYNPLEDR
mgnify:CR=1 FL=1